MKIYKIKNKLKLQNNGNLEIIFLGTGTAFSQLLYNNNIIIIKGNAHILVDFGYNAPISLEKHLGLSPLDIEAFLPTHSHADHIGGVEYLVLNKRYSSPNFPNNPKLKLITTKEYKDILWNYSLKGGLEWNEKKGNTRLKITDYFDILLAKPLSSKDRTKYKIKYKGIDIELFGTNHIPDTAKTQKQAFISYGLMIDKKVMYTSDTKFDKSLLDIYADKAEVIFHDCSFTKNPVHASYDELKTLPEKWKKKIYLMHYNDDYRKFKDDGFAGVTQFGIKYIFD
ncbi:MAG: MBL fold metallo-hydrolase [bacterium]